MRNRVSLFVCMALLAASSAQATDYYLSAAGNDAAAGTAAAPWRTLSRVNATVLQPGDRVLLRAADTFAGTLSLDASDWGTAAAPIAIQSYGTGRATIAAGGGAGISVYNTSGVAIANLVVVGAGGNASGISVYTDLPGDVRLPFIHVDSVDVSGFGRDGVEIGAWNGATGFRDVSVTNAALHGNGRSGLFTYAQVPNVHQQVYVGHVRAYDNTGVAGAATNSGSGIVLASVDGATIERSVAHDNGRLCTSTGGPVGIWTYDATGVVIRHNESYANHTGASWDGGGFDLDQNVSNSIVEYNYSHDNDGAGYLLAQSPSADTHRGNVVRDNVSQNDGRANSYAGIEVWGHVTAAEIYNNTIFMAAAPSGTPRAVRVWNAGVTDRFVSGVHFRNNILQASGAVVLVEATASALAGAADLRFEGNDYFAGGATPSFLWRGTTYAGLSAWRATGQESFAGVPSGLSVDPRLAAAGGGPTLDAAEQLEGLDAYRLRDTSPLVDAGLDLKARFGVDAGSTDFYGTSLPQRGGYDIGASELPATATTAGNDEILILASAVPTLAGAWRKVSDGTAAGGVRLYDPDAGAAKIVTPLAVPVNYFEVTFVADAGKPYRLWTRGLAERNTWTNDSVFVQFSDSVDDGGAATFRIGTTSATTVNLEDDNGAGVSGWGWQDNGWGTGVLGPTIRFATSGLHTMRVQVREDGFSIDQIVLSARRYLTASPGALTNDTTILAPVDPVSSAPAEIVIYASDLAAASLHGNWVVAADATAANGRTLSNPDNGAAKIGTASAAPASYVDVPFTAQAGVKYQVWLRMRAAGNSYANDSVFMQLSGAVDASGQPVARIGTTQASAVVLQDYDGAPISGWGWNDNGWTTLGTPFVFAQGGAQTLRLQQREDGILIDQIVISPVKYLSVAPGTMVNDTTIVGR
jgi:hypothetical protein